MPHGFFFTDPNLAQPQLQLNPKLNSNSNSISNPPPTPTPNPTPTPTPISITALTLTPNPTHKIKNSKFIKFTKIFFLSKVTKNFVNFVIFFLGLWRVLVEVGSGYNFLCLYIMILIYCSSLLKIFFWVWK